MEKPQIQLAALTLLCGDPAFPECFHIAVPFFFAEEAGHRDPDEALGNEDQDAEDLQFGTADSLRQGFHDQIGNRGTGHDGCAHKGVIRIDEEASDEEHTHANGQGCRKSQDDSPPFLQEIIEIDG